MQNVSLWIEQHTLLMFAVLIVICNIAWLMLCHKVIEIKWYEALVIALLHDMIGYAAMRLLAIIEVGGDISRAANMRLFGAVFLLPVLYYLWAKIRKHDKAVVMDIASICLAIGLISGRLNCLTSGCCAGSLISAESGLRWPIREIELVFYIAFIAWYCPKILRRETKGQVYPVFLISYGLLRFVLEWFRVEYSGIGNLHFGTIWSIASILLGMSIYADLKPSKSKKRGRK